MQSAAFFAAGIDALYEAVRVPAGGGGDAVAALRAERFAGFNVTTPLKEEVCPHLQRLTDAARAVGAVNTVKQDGGDLIGHNTDGEGCVRALDELWHPNFESAGVLLLGAGPAARAISAALVSRGARVECWSRRTELAARLGGPPRTRASLVISALPSDAAVPAHVLELIDRRSDIFDVNYGCTRSPVPAGIGARRSDGVPMLLQQGALAFEWWTGIAAPLRAMRSALEDAKGRAQGARTENSSR